MLNVFAGDAFTMASLTASINRVPFKPARIAELGLFSDNGIDTTTAVVEEAAGVLGLIPSRPRGGPANSASPEKRKARSFVVPHLPLEDKVMADEVIGVRKFGSEDQEETAAAVVTRKLTKLRQAHEVTLEWLRAGALQGVVVDGDGSTALYNLFTEFGLGETTVDFALGTSTTDIRGQCLAVKELIEDALGAATYDRVHCLCGSQFFRRFIGHAEVKYAYAYYRESEMLRNDPRAGFEFGGITFEQYRASVGGRPFIPPDVARFFPVGVPDLFVTAYAPATFVEAAGTIGLPFYAKQESLEFDTGIKIHTQSNPLPLCTRPAVLIKGYTSN